MNGIIMKTAKAEIFCMKIKFTRDHNCEHELFVGRTSFDDTNESYEREKSDGKLFTSK